MLAKCAKTLDPSSLQEILDEATPSSSSLGLKNTTKGKKSPKMQGKHHKTFMVAKKSIRRMEADDG